MAAKQAQSGGVTQPIDEVAEYRAERARNWPSQSNVERKELAATQRVARGELDLDVHQAEAKRRRQRLQQVLAQQRGMGHFEASRELSIVVQAAEPGRRAPPAAPPKPRDTADDQERRLREREAAMARIRVSRAITAQPAETADDSDEAPDVILHASRPPPPESSAAPAPSPHVSTAAATAAPAKRKRAPEEPKSVAPAMAGQSSLLRKLLDKDIRRERSHLLQAFRFFENAGLLQDAAAKTS